ncbi:MAG: acyloxyacyl hydrolase [Hyphomicrobiaceae bacterium]
MKLVSLAGVASAALILAVNVPVSAQAADLGGARGSMKDYGPMPVIQQGASGPCYFRADVGYSWSNDPTIKWPVNNDAFNLANGTTYANGDAVSNATRENGMLAEAGVGCGWGGSRGVRVEAMFGYRGERKIDGEPVFYAGVPTDPIPTTTEDPLHTSVRTTTFMLNAYKDLGNFGGFTPYLGAGIGAAYHKLDDVYFTGNANLTNRIHGDNDLAFAWSLMAGVGYQISDRATLDVGYRYIDMGKISSQRSDTGGGVNPAVHFDDLTAHEVKVGLRYNFGGGDCCAVHQPMK